SARAVAWPMPREAPVTRAMREARGLVMVRALYAICGQIEGQSVAVMPELFDVAKGHWRPMERRDLRAVLAVADVVHAAYPEDAAVFEERLLLFGEGCLVFEDGEPGGGIAAYVVSHPWRA